MTLATSMHIANYHRGLEQLVFMEARKVIGIPAEHEFTIHAESGLGWENGEWIASRPGGFRSALDVSHAYGQLLVADADGDADMAEYYASQPPAYIDVRLDTAYGYKVDGMGCSDVHREITAHLGAWLDERGIEWWCQDEFYGDWHHRTPCPLADDLRATLKAKAS